jgi:hypothetical protein
MLFHTSTPEAASAFGTKTNKYKGSEPVGLFTIISALYVEVQSLMVISSLLEFFNAINSASVTVSTPFCGGVENSL